MEMGKPSKKQRDLKIFITYIIILVPIIILGQKEYDTEIEPDSRPGLLWYFTWKPSNKPQPRKYDRFIFDVSYSGLNSTNNLVNNAAFSIGLNANFMNEFALNKRNTVSLGTGLGISTSKASLNNNLLLIENGIIGCFPSVTESGYKKNGLSGTSIYIPVEFRFRTKGWSHFKLHLGGKLGYQLTLKEKYFHVDASRNYKSSLKSASELLTYSVHARFGIRNYAFYASYNLNPIFKHNLSPKMNWFQLGLSISLF